MGASLLIFLNKTDVEGCMTEDEVRQVRGSRSTLGRKKKKKKRANANMALQRLRLDAIKTHKWTILPCSAMTGKNLLDGLTWVVQDAKDRLFLY